MIDFNASGESAGQRAWGRNCPEFGSMSSLGLWIRDNETLLATHFLRLPLERPAKVHACGLFVSRLQDGRLCLRLCEGDDARWLRWKARSTIESGDSLQARALEELWISMREAMGFELLWSLTRDAQDQWQAGGSAIRPNHRHAEYLNA